MVSFIENFRKFRVICNDRKQISDCQDEGKEERNYQRLRGNFGG